MRISAKNSPKDLRKRIENLESVLKLFLKNPLYITDPDVGFNGQKFRKEVFEKMIASIQFDLVIETGTYTGNSTGYLAETSHLPVHSCELNEWYYLIALNRLKEFKNIALSLCDSREFLNKLAQQYSDKVTFFYIDSHWYKDMPLREEIRVICSNWPNFVMMIDDFKVPEDDNFGFDKYGKNNVLAFERIADLAQKFELSCYYPSYGSNIETGRKRGYIILTNKTLSPKLNEIDLLARSKPL